MTYNTVFFTLQLEVAVKNPSNIHQHDDILYYTTKSVEKNLLLSSSEFPRDWLVQTLVETAKQNA